MSEQNQEILIKFRANRNLTLTADLTFLSYFNLTRVTIKDKLKVKLHCSKSLTTNIYGGKSYGDFNKI